MPLGNPPDPQTGHAGQPGDPVPDPFRVSSDPVPAPAPPGSAPQNGTLRNIVEQLATRDQRWKAINAIRCLLLIRSAGQTPPSQALGALNKELGDVATTPRLSTVGVVAGVNQIETRREHLNYDWFGDATQSMWEGNVDAGSSELLVAKRLMQYLEASIGVPVSSDAVGTWGWAQGGQCWQNLKAATPAGSTCTPLSIDWVMATAHGSVTAILANNRLVLKTPLPKDRTGLQFL